MRVAEVCSLTEIQHLLWLCRFSPNALCYYSDFDKSQKNTGIQIDPVKTNTRRKDSCTKAVSIIM